MRTLLLRTGHTDTGFGRVYLEVRHVLIEDFPVVPSPRRARRKFADMGKTKPGKQKLSKIEFQKIAKREQKKKRLVKAARLIVRNLPFKCTEDDIKNHFSKFGNILEVKLLKKNDKFIGCGFVQFDKKNNAAKAIAKTSGIDFMGRDVIVDWAVSKDKFQSLTIKEEPQDDIEIKEEISSDQEANDQVDFSIVKSEDETDSAESHDSGLNQSDGESEDDYDDQQVPLLNGVKTEMTKELKCVPKKPHIIVADESHTIFVKNVPFSATNEDLKMCAEEHGAVNYALICMDPLTEHSKGTGFIQYKKCDIAKQILDGGIQLLLNGTSLVALKPMSKDEVKNNNSKTKVPKDNRNLYLVKEGVILAESPAANGVSKGDMMKRLQLDNWKSQTLKNLHMFVSPTRLVIHNLPLSYDDVKLRALFTKNSPKGSVITEARVMKNLKDFQLSGSPKSKGHGFITFTKHEDALQTLRKLNNNPSIFLPNKRPIVAFSIENRKALQIKERRLLNSKLSVSKTIAKTSEVSEIQGSSKQNNLTRDKTKDDKTTNNMKKHVNSQNQTTHEKPPFSGVTAKFGSRKLRSKRELISQQKQHFINAKKFKKKNKISRKQKRSRKQNS